DPPQLAPAPLRTTPRAARLDAGAARGRPARGRFPLHQAGQPEAAVPPASLPAARGRGAGTSGRHRSPGAGGVQCGGRRARNAALRLRGRPLRPSTEAEWENGRVGEWELEFYSHSPTLPFSHSFPAGLVPALLLLLLRPLRRSPAGSGPGSLPGRLPGAPGGS